MSRMQAVRPVIPTAPVGNSLTCSSNPIAVDLDGTLLKVDTLHEAVLQLLLRRPWMLFALLLAMTGGKAAFKQFVQTHSPLDVESLPARAELLTYLEEEKRKGRRVGLFSAAHQEIVDACSARFGIFEIAMGTSSGRNLSGSSKLETIRTHFGDDFVYAGDAFADLPIWRAANAGIYAGRSRTLRRWVSCATSIEKDLLREGGRVAGWFRALRVHQWSKNFLVFVPAILSAPLLSPGQALTTFVAFFALCLVASATYLINDISDLTSDRQHPSKSARPIASGAIPLTHGFTATLLLAAGAFALTLLLPLQCALTIALYAVVSLVYSFKLKQVALLDVLCLGFLFTVRIAVGATLLENSAPYWLYAFSMFFFTSLALVKRHTELQLMEDQSRTTAPGRRYQVEDLPLVLAVGLGTALCSVVVFLIYLGNDHFDGELFQQPEWLGLSAAILAYWLLRVWLLTLRRQMHDDPVLFALKDSTSYSLGILLGFSLLLAW